MLLVYFALALFLLHHAWIWILTHLRLRGEWWTYPLQIVVVFYGAALIALVLEARTEEDTMRLLYRDAAVGESSAGSSNAGRMRRRSPLF